MLPKSNRLNIRTSFQQIRSTGKKIYHPLLSFYYIQKTDNIAPLLNSVISKKVAKSAVKRNRIRRLIHTSLQKNIEKIKPQTVGLFIVFKDISNYNQEQVQEIIINQLKNANLLI